jgi:cyclomaltodextrinase
MAHRPSSKPSLVCAPALLMLGLSFLVSSASCKMPGNRPELNYPETALLEGPVWPIRLQGPRATVVLSDWFGPDFQPDSVHFPPGSGGRWSSSALGINAGPDLAPVSAVRVWKDGFAYVLPLLRSAKIPLQLKLDALHNPIGPVQVAGEFNDWNPQAAYMTREGDAWSAGLMLEPGRYAYQFVSGGRWFLDPANPDSLDNNAGGYNSVLHVERPQGLPFLRPLRYMPERIILGVEGQLDGWLVLWEYAELDSAWVEQKSNELHIRLPRQALESDLSYLTVIAWNSEGRSNDLSVPLQKGWPAGTEEEAPSDGLEGMTMYFPLVDRFANGDSSNDRPSHDPRVLPPANFFGGDLQGLRQHLDYIQGLGINTLWISPVARNPEGVYQEYPEPRRWFSAYHGYWPVSYREVDPRFGGDEALEALVAEAHQRGMRVLLDFVANHVHQEHPMIRNNPDWATQLNLPDGTRNLRRWNEHRLTTWFDDFLPTLDLENNAISEAVSDSAVYWMERFELDGFRHDATKHIPESFWRTLTAKLKQRLPDKKLYQIGETFGSRDLIASYLGPGLLDAQFDFPLYFAARSTLVADGSDFGALGTELLSSLDAFGHHHLMGNITGNHDMPRFASLAGGGLLPGEDEKEAGWVRLVGIGDPVAYVRSELLAAFLCAIPGVPVVYYGDELGMPGANDPDSRRMMRFSDLSPEESRLQERYQYWLQARQRNPALRYGSTEVVRAEQDLLVIRREWFGRTAYVVLNKGLAPAVFDLPGKGSVSAAGMSAQLLE